MKRALAALLLLAACASEPKLDYVALGYQAADRLADEARPALSGGGPIVYGVFTPVGHPDTSSAFGRIFAEHVSSRFAQRGIPVVELRLREAIAMRGYSGLFKTREKTSTYRSAIGGQPRKKACMKAR